MIPKIIAGNSHSDSRGTLIFNNDFDASTIKRIYTIENSNTNFVRGWQGHKIEQRWFSVIKGSFRIQLVTIDNWDFPSNDLEISNFVLNDKNQDVLHVPGGYASSIQALEEGSKLLVMADYRFGEIQDEYRFEVDRFK